MAKQVVIDQPSGNWVLFASSMLSLLGGMQIIAGFVGVFNPEFFATTGGRLMLFDQSTWGWLHLVLGLASLTAAAGVLLGAMWARVYGVFLASLVLLSHLVFLTAYPLWSLVGIIINGLVIYALTLHGDELGN